MTERATAITKHERQEFVCRSWPAQPQHLVSLRGEVRRWLAPLGLSVDTECNVTLAVNEAAKNCTEHAYPSANPGDTVDLTFWTESGSIWIEVVDHGVWRSPHGSTGHGTEIMRRLVPVVLIHYDRRGTRVLLGHPLPRPPLPRPRAPLTAVRDATLAAVDLLGGGRPARSPRRAEDRSSLRGGGSAQAEPGEAGHPRDDAVDREGTN